MTVYRFKINDAFTPQTIPMARLAEYMTELARVFGEQEHVHLSEVREGSVEVYADIDFSAATKVERRLLSINSDPAGDLKKALERIDELLASDNATGDLKDADGKVLFRFKGRDRPIPLAYGPFREDGFIDGQIIRIGGKDETIHVTLMDGDRVYTGCTVGRDLAKKMAAYFLGPSIRVHGNGTWERKGSGEWDLKGFRISDFEALDDNPLGDVIAKLRQVSGNEWIEEVDPVSLILRERGNGEVSH
jgi:hypothetical protein